jgi:nicotinamidase/pyrazinamidase
MRDKGYQIVFTQDWHPKKHSSFAKTYGKEAKLPPEFITLKREDGTEYKQEIWPVHCVQESDNAKILINIKEDDIVQQKGTRKAYDSYSGFEDAGNQATGLADKLKAKGIKNIIILGLATDFCVKHTALDGIKSGFKVTFVEDLSRAIVEGAGIDEMAKAGVAKVQSRTF